MALYNKLPMLLGVVIFALILWQSNLPEIIRRLAGINIAFFLSALAFGFSTILVNAFKWRLLVNSFGKKYGYRKAVGTWMTGFTAGAVTPGRLGDFLRAFYARKEAGLELGKSLSTVAADRVADLLALFLLAFLGIFSVLTGLSTLPLESGLLYTLAAVFLVFMALIALLTKKEKTRALLGPVYRSMVPAKYKSKARMSFNGFYAGVKHILKSRQLLAKLFLLSLASWTLAILQCFMLALSLKIDVAFSAFVFFIPIVFLLETLPITVSGIGVRDAFLILVFSAFLLPSELAISFSFSILFINIILVLFSSLAWLSKKEWI